MGDRGRELAGCLSVIGLSGSSLLQLCLQGREGRGMAGKAGKAGKGDDSLGHAGSGGGCPSRTVQTCEAGLRTLEVCFARVEGSGSWVVGRGLWVRGRPRTGRDVDRHTARADRKSRPGRRPIGRYNRGPSTTQEFASTSFA
jgi:hypothetical protein